MMEDFGVTVVVPLVLAAISYFAYRVYTSGLFDEPKVSVVESVPHLAKPLVVYYKYHIGGYGKVKNLFEEASSLVPKDAKTFGLYYDDPRETKEDLCQSAIGVIFGEDEHNLYDDNYSNQLNRWGYERMTLPAVKRAVVLRQRYTGFFSLLVMIYKSYKTIAQFITDNRLETGLSVEVYSTDESGNGVVDIIFPLDHQHEFYVEEHVSTEELTSKLARRHFDSDLSDSESEPEGDEMEDEAAAKSADEEVVSQKEE